MTILATIVVLGVLIFVHELGHFAAAKAVGIEVQRFSIGLGPRITGFTRGETEYVLSWIPLGGYVKMGGMDDEVMEQIEGGAVEEERTPSPRDFDAKPIWARTLVISAGVIMNMVFALVTYIGVNAVYGVQAPQETRVGLVQAETLPEGASALAELPIGAEIRSVADRSVEHWGDIRDAILEAPSGEITVETASPDRTFRVELADEEQRRRILGSVVWWIPAGIGQVNPGSPAQDAGLERGDRVISAGDREVGTWHDFVEVVRQHPEQPLQVVLERDGTRLVRTVTPNAATQEDPQTGEIQTIGQIGVFQPNVEVAYQPVTIAEATVMGWQETVGVTELILGFLRDLFTGGISPRSVGSIVTIGAASGEAAEAGPAIFLRFMALFSINLAILNLLPIPILDGGHLVFLAIEAVRGKALSVEQRLKWSNIGFLVVMGIMVWALSNDILRLFGM